MNAEMKPVLDWLKANVLIVVFSAIIIGAPIGMFVVASSMSDDLADEVESRAREISRLQRLEQNDVEYRVAGQQVFSHSGVIVNQALLERYREVAQGVRLEAEEIRQQVLEKNRQGRGVLRDGVFPHPPATREHVVKRNFYEAIEPEYRSLLHRLGAGAPPSPERVFDEVERHQHRFVSQVLNRPDLESLTDEEREQLQDELVRVRMNRYGEEAQAMSVYADLGAFHLPYVGDNEEPTMADLYNWQADFWIVQDIMEAIALANANDTSVISSPVKHVVGVDVLYSVPSAEGDDGDGGSRGRRGRGGGQGGGGQSGSGSGGGALPNPSSEVPLDYSESFTGRVTNSLYDVRPVQVELIVDAERLIEVVEAFAEQNFMTVLSINAEPVDTYEAMKDGYYYGEGEISRVTMDVETVWLREWTTQYMPDSIRRGLGIPVEADEAQAE